MTTEDDFHAALDAHPDDWQTRLVFADWLQEREYPCPHCHGTGLYLGMLAESNPGTCDHCTGGVRRGDPRAEGYRALGVLRRRPKESEPGEYVWVYPSPITAGKPATLEIEWLNCFESVRDETHPAGNQWTRREAEDAAALAFAKLPAARRAELLDPTTTGART